MNEIDLYELIKVFLNDKNTVDNEIIEYISDLLEYHDLEVGTIKNILERLIILIVENKNEEIRENLLLAMSNAYFRYDENFLKDFDLEPIISIQNELHPVNLSYLVDIIGISKNKKYLNFLKSLKNNKNQRVLESLKNAFDEFNQNY